jgi:hypothetical protein
MRRTKLRSLSDELTPASMVSSELADTIEPGLIATAGQRYFGFDVGGAFEVPTAPDVLTSGWEQTDLST